MTTTDPNRLMITRCLRERKGAVVYWKRAFVPRGSYLFHSMYFTVHILNQPIIDLELRSFSERRDFISSKDLY